MPPDEFGLPDMIDEWKLDGPPRRIDNNNIFDYMNGAGELYLSYNLDHLLVYNYKDDEDNDLKVEIYQMSGPSDAFGLLSLDWGGEPVELKDAGSVETGIEIIPNSRALYGKGLLRAWSDDLYIRIMANRDTPENRKTVLALGRMIAAGRNDPSSPELLEIIKPGADSPWRIRVDRTAYFYSHLVLNSLFYLSHENILNLSGATEGMIVIFEKVEEDGIKVSIPLLIIKYPDNKKAYNALTDFYKAYLPELERESNLGKDRENMDFFDIEDGLLGYRLAGRYLAMVFGCPDEASGIEVLNRADLR